ncbi:MAG: Fe-S cluster assembly protein SufD [Acidobacteriota bacterium]|nr:Fe-S cluster assembly protein SufD [Acidobacteriota bacterium]
MLNQFTEQFKESLKSEENAWLRGLRADAFSFFSASGFPTVQNEDWKYTNVGKVGSEQWKVGGKSLSDPELIGAFEALLKNFDYKRNGFTALNLAFADIVCIRIPKETKLEKPIEVLLTGDDENTANFPHVLIIAEAGSKARILETYTSLGKNFTNTAVQIVVEDNANLTHYRVQKESAEAFHIGTTDVTLGRGSLYDSTNINLGAVLSRHDINVKFSAEGGECFVDGLYMLNGSQHSDTHSVIDHAVPNCVSHQTYKGVLNDKSRGVFNGKVFVRENASGTDAKQSNKNLLLSNEARVDTKPQLEIFNDDVKCAHGATVGQLEEEELFYLLTRGLNNELARNLLTYGFAEEIINKIGIESIKKQLDEAVLNRLNANLEA